MCIRDRSNRPPLRQYLLDGEFFVGAAIACTLAKLALRYLDMEEDKEKQNVSLWLHYINFSSFFVINRHRPCIFFRTAAGLVSLVSVSEQWNVAVLFHVIIHSSPFNLSVFILAGVLRKLHARHGQYLTPWKVRTTQEGVCFRDGLRVCSPPLWPCALYPMLLLFFADYYGWWCGSHLPLCTCCGRACSSHEEHLHCGVSQFLVVHAGR